MGWSKVRRYSLNERGQARIRQTQSFHLTIKHFSFDHLFVLFVSGEMWENADVITRLWNDSVITGNHLRKVFLVIKQNEVINLLFLLL